MRFSHLGFGVAATLLIATACGGGKATAGAQTYTVAADTASPAGKNFQFATFFPSALKVHPGDSIAFENRSTQAPHTVTFGVAGDRSNQPPPGLPTGGQNPAVLMPCYTDEAPSSSLIACPTPAGARPAPYAGKGYWNSGFLSPASAPSGTKAVTVKLSDSIAPGAYVYLCILHRPMAATITVVARAAERDTPAAVRARATKEITTLTDQAAAITDPESGLSGRTFSAVAGWSGGFIAVNRFLPQTIQVSVGTTVSWYAKSTFEPHTVTFGSTFASGADDPQAFAPAGVRSGSPYSGGLANSGFVPPGTPQPMFSLTFTKAGEYAYVCVLHPGMDGVVKVT